MVRLLLKSPSTLNLIWTITYHWLMLILNK